MFSILTRPVFLAIVACICFAQPAAAKNAALFHPEGAKVQIKCAKKHCFVRHTNASGRSGKVNSAGPSTTYNFARLVKLWQARGYR